MTMPMTGVRGGERLHNDDSRPALRRPACGGFLGLLLRNRPVRRSDQIDGVFARQRVPVAGNKPIEDSASGPTWDSATQDQLSAERDKGLHGSASDD